MVKFLELFQIRTHRKKNKTIVQHFFLLRKKRKSVLLAQEQTKLKFCSYWAGFREENSAAFWFKFGLGTFWHISLFLKGKLPFENCILFDFPVYSCCISLFKIFGNLINRILLQWISPIRKTKLDGRKIQFRRFAQIDWATAHLRLTKLQNQICNRITVDNLVFFSKKNRSLGEAVVDQILRRGFAS